MFKNFIALISLLLIGSACSDLIPPTDGEGDSLRWMDRDIYFADSNGLYPQRNNEFQKQKIKDAINEISEITDLGSNYFSFHEIDESLLVPVVEKTESTEEYKSFILILPDEDFNDFVFNQLGGDIPDENAVTIINSAYKRKFFMLFKSSCFSSSETCGGISGDLGLKAMVARQFSLLVGLTIKDCSAFPEDVMCSDQPKDDQWRQENRDAWAANFNNQLEAIKLTPGFYDETSP